MLPDVPHNAKHVGWDDSDLDTWGDPGVGKRRFRALTREEAQALRAAEPPLSPWRVVAAQAAVGVVVAVALAVLLGGSEYGWSALYGAATAVVPGALLARGATSRIATMSPGVGAASFMVWESVKIGVTVVMLMLAPRLVQPLSWPALLVALLVCMKVYWFALLWRRAPRGRQEGDGERSSR